MEKVLENCRSWQRVLEMETGMQQEPIESKGRLLEAQCLYLQCRFETDETGRKETHFFFPFA